LPTIPAKSNVFARSRRRANMLKRCQPKYKPRLATVAKFRTLLYCTASYWIICRASQYLITSRPNCHHSINKCLWGIRSTRILGLPFVSNDSYLVIFVLVITNGTYSLKFLFFIGRIMFHHNTLQYFESIHFSFHGNTKLYSTAAKLQL